MAFSAGLFADLGVLVFAQTVPEHYPKAYLQHCHHGGLVAAELDMFGLDHAAVSARLLQRWSFPQDLTDAVAHHQCCESDRPVLDQSVYAASLLAEVLWVPSSPHMAELQRVLQREFHRDTDGLIALALDCKDAFADCAGLLRVNVSPGQIDADSLRQEAQRQFHLAALDASLELDALEAIVDDTVE